MITRELQLTADGSHTLFIPEMDEHYHSVNGAIQESRHVFIEAGLLQIKKTDVRILEIGFGTGLNAFMTLLKTEALNLPVSYYSLERYPLDEQLARTLNYTSQLAPDRDADFMALHQAPWDESVRITSTFTLHKMEGDANRLELPDQIDLIYFDAFAPEKQPDMWNQELFDHLYTCTSAGGVLTTYCAKGIVRRMMQKAGYSVERIPGPPGKREMLRARKL